MKWFRLYTEILDDPKINQLNSVQFRNFIQLLCITCEQEMNGIITFSLDEIAWRLRTSKEPLKKTIEKLMGLGILSNNGHGIEFVNWEKRQFKSDTSKERTRKWREKMDANVTSQDRHKERHSDALEQSREEKSIYEPPAEDSCPHEDIVKLYHEILPELPKIKKWTSTRQKYLRARWKEDKQRQNPDWWKRFFEYVKENDFLTGKKGDWTPNLEWLVKESNFYKTIEGLYDR